MKRLLLLGALLTAAALAACGYADPYGAGGPVANESPNPSSSPNVTPGVDDFATCNNLTGVTYPDGLKIMEKFHYGSSANDAGFTRWRAAEGLTAQQYEQKFGQWQDFFTKQFVQK